MVKQIRDRIREEARKTGKRHGKVSELDFGAGAEWMFEEVMLGIIRKAYRAGYEKGHFDTAEGGYSPEQSAEDFNIEDIE